MKKRITTSLLTFILLSSGMFAQSQTSLNETILDEPMLDEPYLRHSMDAYVGYSLVGTLFKVLEATSDVASTTSNTEYVDFSHIPALQLNYDHRVADWFSIGPAISYQTFKIQYFNYNTQGNNFKTKLTRMHLGVRPLFHYGKSDSFDLYSGLRIGYKSWNIDTTTDDPDYDIQDEIGFSSGFGLQVILFGFKGYFNDHLGVGMEITAGAPHFAAGGINYRF